MRRAAVITAGVLVLLCALAACENSPSASAPSGGSTAPTSVTPPAAPVPATIAACPYLDRDTVADINGQHVGQVKISTAHGASPPSCFYYRPDGSLQLSVRVYVGDPRTAKGIVNQATPVSTSSPATQPAGWQGGYQSIDSGAVYAVARNGDAVVVHTNQAQSIKARAIAELAITALKL